MLDLQTIIFLFGKVAGSFNLKLSDDLSVVFDKTNHPVYKFGCNVKLFRNTKCETFPFIRCDFVFSTPNIEDLVNKCNKLIILMNGENDIL